MNQIVVYFDQHLVAHKCRWLKYTTPWDPWRPIMGCAKIVSKSFMGINLELYCRNRQKMTTILRKEFASC
jgi:hypothetical protein